MNNEQTVWESEFDDEFCLADGKTLGDWFGSPQLKAFIRKTLLERDKFWQEQEMGVATDCDEHTLVALLAQKQNLREKIEGLDDGMDFGNEAAKDGFMLAKNFALALLNEQTP